MEFNSGCPWEAGGQSRLAEGPQQFYSCIMPNELPACHLDLPRSMHTGRDPRVLGILLDASLDPENAVPRISELQKEKHLSDCSVETRYQQ